VTITLNNNGLELDGQTIPVYSGTIHYWRLDRAKWGLILDQAKALGFNMVETYIPWSVHETSPGHYDWGQVDDRKDVEAFIKLCEERQLHLIVRPGPLINAELTGFGYPEWVLMDPAVQARTALNTIHYDAAWGLHPPHPFPVPSYASEAFYKYAEGWFDAICPILARHLAPQGCIVAVQSDNETCYLFQDQAYATDYAPDSLALYRTYLKDKYGTLEKLNAAYHHYYLDFAFVEPPRDCEIQTRADVPRHVDWVEYKEHQIRWAVARFSRILKARGILGVPIFQDVAWQLQTPLDIPAMEADPDIDWVGINLYANKEDYARAATQMRFLAGATRLPFVPEFGSGLWSHHHKTFTSEEHQFITLGSLLHGLKAFNFYMLAERERWQGSPITRHGTLRADRAPFYQQLTQFLQHYRFWEFTKQRETIVLFNYDAGRYAAYASTLHLAHVDMLGLPKELFDVTPDLGFSTDPRSESKPRLGSWFGTATQWLANHHVWFDLGDTHLNAAQLQRYRLVCLPTVDFLDPMAQQELLTYVQSGGHLILGPVKPTLDPALNPSTLLADHLSIPGTISLGSGRLTWATLESLPTILSGAAPLPTFTCDQPLVDLALHCRPDLSLLFAANPTAESLVTNLSFTGTQTFKPAWPSAPELTGTDSATLTLPPYTVYIWEVSHD
jgi:beta-galactosidase